jgi:hypothetical protein
VNSFKNTIRLEELAIMALCFYGLYFLHAEWWFYLLLLLGPDISMLGYLAGNKAGAFAYNLFHHKAVAVLVLIAGISFSIHYLVLTGIVLLGHSSMDRFFGYGLKSTEGFKYTHLGIIGKQQQ